MAIRNIVKKGDDILNKKCRDVVKFDDRLSETIEDMKETLRQSKGVGLAAPQIGILRCYAVVDLSDDGDNIIEIINPKIIEQSGEQQEIEGCLSCPKEWGITSRPAKVKVEAQDVNGKTFTIEGEGITARAFCHEIDHLSGILFTSKIVKQLSEEEIMEMRKADSKS